MGTVILLFFLITNSWAHSGEDVVYYTETGHAEFHSEVPLDSFTGASDHLVGMIDLDNGEIDFYLDLETLDSGNDRRDRDMYRTLNVEDHPFAEFTGSLETDFDDDTINTQTVVASGEFTVNGVARDFTVEGSLQYLGGSLILSVEWVLDLTDYEIEPPSILFYRVADEIEIQVEATLNQVDRDEM